MEPKPKCIYVDFNTESAHRKIDLDGRGSLNDIQRQGGDLVDGEEVVLYEPDVEDGEPYYITVKAIVRWDSERGKWIADFGRNKFEWIELKMFESAYPFVRESKT